MLSFDCYLSFSGRIENTVSIYIYVSVVVVFLLLLFFLLGSIGHTASRHRFKQSLYFRGATGESMSPKVIPRVLDQLNERYQQPPRMGSIHDQSLEQYPRYLLLDDLLVGLGKHKQQYAAEIVGVVVGISQLVGNRVEE